MPIFLKERQGNDSLTRKGIGANNLDLTNGATFLKRAGNVISQASAATDRLIGVNITEVLFSATNQTVALKEVKYLPKDVYALYRVAISGGAVTAANEGQFFNLSAADTVGGATVSTIPFYTKTDDAGVAIDPLLSMQLELVRFESATMGWFRIINP